MDGFLFFLDLDLSGSDITIIQCVQLQDRPKDLMNSAYVFFFKVGSLSIIVRLVTTQKIR